VAREPSLDCYDVSVSNGDMAIVLDLGAIDDATELESPYAEAVAFLVARRVLNRIAYARCRTRTGADYRLRRPGAADSDSYERLEVSGIGGGTEPAFSRLREKLTRLAEYAEEPPGFAIVTNFRDDPVEILVGRYAP